MIDLSRHSRSLAIAILVVALSASAALAAAPSFIPPSGSPTANASETADGSEAPEASESEAPEASESEAPEASDAAKAPDATDGAGDHGALVSTAAQMTTPAGFANHGAFVSCVAHLDATLATIDWTTVTPQSCGQTTQATSPTNQAPTGHGHGHGHGHGRPSWAGKPGS